MLRFACVISIAVFGFGQQIQFEVASVRPNKSGSGSSHWSSNDREGRLRGENIKLRDLIENAYSVKAYQIAGPDWLKSEGYDIVAKSDGPVEKGQFAQTLQALLAERFKLAFHRESKVLPVYELVVAKCGLKILALKGGEGHSSSHSNNGRYTAERVTLANLQISCRGKPTVRFWTRREWRARSTYTWSGRPKRSGWDRATAQRTMPPRIYTAVQEQLGLKLEARSNPLEVLVIDHAERGANRELGVR